MAASCCICLTIMVFGSADERSREDDMGSMTMGWSVSSQGSRVLG